MIEAAMVDRLFRQAELASREGRVGEAEATYRRILTAMPDNARAMNALGNIELGAGRAIDARRLFETAARIADAPAIWLNVAIAARMSGDSLGELAALDRALIVDPYFVFALLQKGQWFERHGRLKESARTYRALLLCCPPLDQLAPPMQEAMAYVRRIVADDEFARDAAIQTALIGAPQRSERFDHCLDVLAGRRRVFVHQPIGLHFPYLPAIQFFDPALFPWFAQLEAATAIIREELRAMSEVIVSQPYVQVPAGQPVNQWDRLNNSPDWSALFLWKDGAPVERSLALAPQTAAILRDLPMLDIPDRGPTVMLSILQPHTRIPPHTGVTNTRSVVHFPLVVPDKCGFRVGSETREWVEGKTWAFDDTIEHEAWNDSDRPRIIVIIDAWNPFLSEDERELLRITTGALKAYDGMASGMV